MEERIRKILSEEREAAYQRIITAVLGSYVTQRVFYTVLGVFAAAVFTLSISFWNVHKASQTLTVKAMQDRIDAIETEMAEVHETVIIMKTAHDIEQ